MYSLGALLLLVLRYAQAQDSYYDNTPIKAPHSLNNSLNSRTGDSQLTSAEHNSGVGSVSPVSIGTQNSLDPVTSVQSTGDRFRRDVKAQQENTPTCNCGSRNNRSLFVSGYTNTTSYDDDDDDDDVFIVEGTFTKPNEFPMMAGIIYFGENVIKCGAVIISHTYVLTAAHCVKGKSNNNLGVVIGIHDTEDVGKTPDIQLFKVEEVIEHPQFNFITLDNDIAIVRIQGTIKYSENVGPVCLPFKFANNDLAGAVVTMLGWGTIFFGGPKSTVLQKVNVDVISQQSCRNNFPDLTARQICTYRRGKDACQGDSGGPLLYKDRSSRRLFNVGVISFGHSCGSEKSSVNTRITPFLDWIVENAPDNYCKI